MAKSFGSLGDFFPDKDLGCRIRGCNNVWHFSGEDALHNVAQGGKARPDRMCDDCFKEYQNLSDIEVPCSRESCKKTWTWSRFRQLEGIRQGHSSPPRGICDDCRQEINNTEDKEIECRIRGCKNTWTWQGRDQVVSGGGAAPKRLCESCFTKLKSLRDEEMPCRVRSCKATWSWNRYQQLEYLAAGKTLETPPKRMCIECYNQFNTLADRELPCKVNECSRTWTYTAFDQLDGIVAAEGQEPETPERMCQACYRFYLQAIDHEERCKNRGCAKTWTYTKSMQLHDWLKKRRRAPVRMCEDCARRLKSLTDKQVECMVPGCDGHWVYPSQDQLKDELQGKREPSPHRCRECEKFLSEHEVQTLACVHCSADIQWSVYEQLLCERGTFVKPTQCTKCAKETLALNTPKAPPLRSHHHIVRIPPAGRWHEVERIRDWPKHMTYETIEKVEQADIRIVAIGDDLTWSGEDVELTWPYLLEKKLNEKLGPERSVAVVNAGIVQCTSQEGFMRLSRDIAPFAPHVVIFSFAHADALIRGKSRDGEWRYNANEDGLENDIARFANALASKDCRLLHWTTSPIFPEDARHEDAKDGWDRQQQSSTDHVLRINRHVCMQQDIPILHLRSRFEINGALSARKWMSNWFMPNEVGIRNIATWFAEHLLNSGILPAPKSDS